MFLSPVRVTNPAPVPETTLELLHGVVFQHRTRPQYGY